jgi:transcriptional regulator with XRE-family HTH domain
MDVIHTTTSASISIPPTPVWLGNPGGLPQAAANPDPVPLPPAVSSAPTGPLHRLGEVRRREGLTLSKLARHLGVSIAKVKEEEQPASDILLSEFYRWQAALGVPAAELLNEPANELSPPVELRARLLRVMKTARSLQEVARQPSVRRLAGTLIEQLVEIMPELKETVAWPVAGRRRAQRELGQAFLRGLSFKPSDELEPPEP